MASVAAGAQPAPRGRRLRRAPLMRVLSGETIPVITTPAAPLPVVSDQWDYIRLQY